MKPRSVKPSLSVNQAVYTTFTKFFAQTSSMWR